LTSSITSRVSASGSNALRGGTAPRAAGAEGLAGVGIEVPLAAERRVRVLRVHQHAVPLALLAVEVLHAQRLAPARVRRELAHAAEEVAVLADLQRQLAGLGDGLDRLKHAPVARRRHHQLRGL
jgi:hypothetical protein